MSDSDGGLDPMLRNELLSCRARIPRSDHPGEKLSNSRSQWTHVLPGSDLSSAP